MQQITFRQDLVLVRQETLEMFSLVNQQLAPQKNQLEQNLPLLCGFFYAVSLFTNLSVKARSI